jgi:putative phage-type endonuclease
MDMDKEGRERWLAERRKGIGGTDAAAILGLSKYRTAYDVWLEKRGEAPDEAPARSERLWWGRELEALIAKRYSQETGRLLLDPEKVFVHPDYPELLGTPDRLVARERRGLEIKTASTHVAEEWGAQGTDEVPPAYAAQVIHYMAVTGLPVWDIAVLVGGNDFRVYTVARNAELERAFIERLREWWQAHVVGGLRPDITGADSTTELLNRRFPREVGPMLDADSATQRWLDALEAARAVLSTAEEKKAEAENNLKALMGEAEGIRGPRSSVTWRATRGARRIDYKDAFLHLVNRFPEQDRAQIQESIEATFALTVPGVRRFLFSRAKGKE